MRAAASRTDEPTARDAGEEPPPRARSPVGDRWAVLVGITDYADERLTLRYAHRDAEALHDFLLTPAGGAFSEKNIRLLLDENATRDAVSRAFRTFLAQTKEDDLVLIYMACHGAPDETAARRPLYVLTHETNLDDIAGTALPMHEIDWSLKNYVRAGRVVILADTCHSEGIATGGRGSDVSAAVLNRYLDQLSATTPGVAYLASARENQRSYENEKWGKGHGAFTWFLLEGMRGAADGWAGRARDNIVTLDELADYVSERVFQETERRQRPILGPGRYDPELPLAVSGSLDLAKHLQLARAFMEVGWLLDDPAPFLCAAREASAARVLASLSGEAAPSADALTGEALLAAGEAGEAARVLSKALERHGEKLPPESWLHLGLAKVDLVETAAAAEALSEFAKRSPESPETGWASDYAAWLEGSRGGITRALVIAVGTYAFAGIPPLAGPPNDAELITEFLRDRLGVAPQHLTVLLDSSATRTAVADALGQLAHDARSSDSVIVYFGGHAMPEAAAQEPYLITHDASNDVLTGISAHELHSFLSAIPGRTRLLLLDTHGNAAFNDLVGRDPGTAVLAASAPGKMAYEGEMNGRAHGAFTAALVEAWNDTPDPLRLTYAELAAAVATRTAQLFPQHQQTPLLLAHTQEIVLEGRFPAADLWRLGRMRTSGPIPPAAVAACVTNGWPRGRRLVARDLANRKEFAKALPSLRAVAEDERDAESWIELAHVAVSAGGFGDALTALDSFDALPASDRWYVSAKQVADAVGAMRDARGRALLIAVDSYADGALPPVEGAGADLDAMRDFLVAHGFSRSTMTELRDEQATRAAILDRFTSLTKHAENELGVLYFAGNGSRSALGEPTIVPYDGRSGGADDISLTDLAAVAGQAANLVTIVDAACGYDGGGPGARSASAAPGVAETRDSSATLGDTAAVGPIGAVTVLHEVPAGRQPPDGRPRERPSAGGIVRGTLTASLLETGIDADSLTYLRWAQEAGRKADETVWALGPGAVDPVFQHRTRRAAMMRELQAVETAPAANALDLAEQEAAHLRQRNEQSPVTDVERGLALAVTGRTEDAIRAFRSARNALDDERIYEEQSRRLPDIHVWDREARFHLGRLLYEHHEGADDLNDAVASLRQALEQAPDDLRITLHLGLAIRALVERQSLVEATDLLQRYLDAGAPLGRADEVRAFLERDPPTSGGDDTSLDSEPNPDFE